MTLSGAPGSRESSSRAILWFRLFYFFFTAACIAPSASAQYQTYPVLTSVSSLPAGSYGATFSASTMDSSTTANFKVCFDTGYGSSKVPILPDKYIYTNSGQASRFDYTVPASTIQEVPPSAFVAGIFIVSIYTIPTTFTACNGSPPGEPTGSTPVFLRYPVIYSVSLPSLPRQNAALSARKPSRITITGENFTAQSGTKGNVPSAVNFISSTTVAGNVTLVSDTSLVSTIPSTIPAAASSVAIKVCNVAAYSYCSSSLELKTVDLQRNPGTLSASPNPAATTQAVALTANFGPGQHSTAGAPSGHVTFSDAGRSLGTAQLALDKTATFAQAPTQQFLTYAVPIAPIVADFNRDGIPDTLFIDPGTGNAGASLNLLLGTVPSGRFTANRQFTVVGDGTSFIISSAAVGDFNCDGIPDLILLAKEKIPGAVSPLKLYTLLGNGDGTFQNGFVSSPTLYGAQIVAGDFNKDGKQDILIAGALTAGGTIGLQTLYGDNTGKFTAGPATTGLRTAPSPYFGDFKVVAADLNADGYPDIAVMNGYSPQGELDNSVEIYRNTGKGAFAAPVRVQTDGTATANFSIAALGPGKPLDMIVISTANPGIYVGLNQSTSTKIAFFDTFELTQVPGLNQAVVGDFDGDGLLDVAVEDQQTIHVLSGDGEASFAAKYASLSIPRPAGSTLIAASDENGDTYSDLLLYTAGAQDGNTRYPIALYDYITAGTATATFPAATYAAGIHALEASTNGTFNILAGTATATLNITQIKPTIIVTSSPGSPQPYIGSPTTLVGTVIDNSADPAAGSTATGTASFYNGNALLGTAPIVTTAGAAGQESAAASLKLINLPAGNYNFTVRYPGDASHAAAISRILALQVTPGTPSISWKPDPTTYPYGTRLSSDQLNAVATGVTGEPVAGTFTYAPSLDALLSVGTHQVVATFNPADANYTSTTATHNIVVTQAVPVISWKPNPATLVYGTALSAAQLDATSPTPGTFVYTPSRGTVLAAGAHTLSTTFTPNDAVDFAPSTATATVNVTPATSATTLSITSAGDAAASIPSGAVATLTATVSAAGGPVTPGQVGFCDANYPHCTDVHLLGITQLTSAGTATLQFRPGIGSHAYKAIFLGTGSTAASSSTTLPLAVTGTYTTSTMIVQSGLPGDYTLTAATTGVSPLLATPPTGDISFLDTSNGDAVLGTQPLGASTPGFDLITSATVEAGTDPNSAVTADFNGDGKPDFAIASADHLYVFLGKGDGTFTAAPIGPALSGSDSFIASGDFNGDGKADLVLTNAGNTLTVLLGNGNGTFTAAASPVTGSNPSFVAVADLNRDGIADLVVVTNDGAEGVEQHLTVLLGAGDGTFKAAASPTFGALTATPTAVAIGDFNEDGKVDLAVTNCCATGSGYTSGVSILLGNGDGTFQSPKILPQSGQLTPSYIVAGDLNGDGHLDLASLSAASNLVVFLGDGSGNFSKGIDSYAAGGAGTGLVMGDFNGDGKPDLASSSMLELCVLVLLGNGTGGFTPAGLPATGQYPSLPASADFNGDGVADLVTPNEIGSASVLLSVPTQTATAILSKVSPSGGGTHKVDAAYAGDTKYKASRSEPTALTGLLSVPIITWKPNPATIVYGTPLSAAELNASSSTPGIFTYKPAFGTTPTVGSPTLSVLFTPTDTGHFQSVTATATVTVTQATPAVTWLPNPATIAYGTALSSAQLDAASATPGTFAYTPAPGVLPAAGTQTLTAVFTPNDAKDFKSIATTVSIVVTVAPPVINWMPNPATIPYGTALSSAQLDATASTPGTFVYTPAAGTVLSAGTQILSALFTPKDVTDFKPIATTTTIIVSAATPTVTWTPNAATISYGTALTAAQLNATSTTAGTFTYTPGLGTVLNVGVQTLSAFFTPSDTANFKPFTTTATITVTPAIPAITWSPSPVAIAYGTPLTFAQLDATSTTPGTFIYVPALGTVLSAGTQTLSVLFNPTDSKNFKPVTATATINVTASIPSLKWVPSPATVPYGTPLSAAQLDATSTTPGTFLYTPAAGTILTAGSQTLSVAFTPTDTKDFKALSTTAFIVIQPVTPTIVWDPPANIITGTALSATQLDATATGANGAVLPGTFTYTPASGTLLSPGPQTLKVVFTPADLADYTTATSSVSLQVVPLTLASLSSTQAALGDPAKTITLTGTGFVSTAVVQVNGSAIPSTFVNATTLTATIPAADFLLAQILQINVSEAAQNQTTASIAFLVGAPLASAVFAGPSTILPGTDTELNFKLTNPYPVELTANFTVSFTPAPDLPDDPGVLFPNGKNTYAVIIPANSTAVPSVAVQGSTVAGSMTLTLALTAGGVDVTPPSIQPLVIRAPLAVPGVSSAAVTRDGNILIVVVRGLSNPRDMTSVKFHFTPVRGGSIRTEDVTIDVVPIFTTWYADPASLQYGSTFTYTQSFDLSSDASVVGQVSVTLTNSVGQSQEADTP